MTVLRILFAAGFVYAICRAAGRLLLRAIRLTVHKDETGFLAFTLGVALVSTVVFTLAACHLIYTWILAGMGICILAAWWRFGREAPTVDAAGSNSLPFLGKALFWGPYLVYGCLYVLAAMMPEISPDGTVYHVGLVVRYYEHRGFYPMTTEMYSGLSGGIEMLFLVAFALGRHSATAMAHLLFLLSLPFGMMSYARRMSIPRAGVIGALLFYLAPVVGRDGTSAYIDVAAAAIVFSGFYFLEIWRGEDNWRVLIPAGLLAGFAYACKFTAGVFAVYGLIYVIAVCISRRLRWRNTAKRGAVFSFLACVTAAPWVVKDIIQFHNPFYPLFNGWFPNPYQYPMVEAEWRQMLAHMNDITLSQIPYQLTMGGRLDGIVGPVFLLSGLALLSLRSKTGRRLMLAFVPVFLPYFGNIGARFMILPLPFLSMALAIGLLSIPRVGSGLAVAAVLLHAVFSWPAFIDRWLPKNQWRIEPPRLKFVLRKVPEQQFLREHWRDYEPGLLLDNNVPRGDKVFSPSMGQMAYQHREVLGTFDSAAGRRAWETLLTPIEAGRFSTWVREFRFAPLSAREVRLIADSDRPLDMSVGELRFFLNGAELARDKSWRLEATSNPWEVQLAFDNSPVSWWTSGQRVEFGMFLGVRFGKETLLDGATVEQVVDQRWTPMHLEALIHGGWRSLRAREQGTEHPPRADLRMRVSDEFKRQGIRWILIPDSSIGAVDLRNNAPYWGITEVGEANGYRLWKID